MTLVTAENIREGLGLQWGKGGGVPNVRLKNKVTNML